MKKNLTINWAIAHLSNFEEKNPVSRAIFKEKAARIKSYLAKHAYQNLVILCSGETLQDAEIITEILSKEEIPVMSIKIDKNLNTRKDDFRNDIENYMKTFIPEGAPYFFIFSCPKDAIPLFLERLSLITEEEAMKGFEIPFGSFFNIHRLEEIKRLEELKTLGPAIAIQFSREL